MNRIPIVAVLAILTAGNALGQTYPTRPLRWIVPYPPGGSSDSVSRVIATELASRLGQPVVIETRPGAGGSLGLELVARANPDGYTIGAGSNGGVVINPHLSEKPSFDPLRDLVAVAKINEVPVVAVANPSAPFSSIKELIDAARAKPRAFSFASTGNNSLMHLSGELFNKEAKVQIVHVPYKGSAPAVTDIVAGHVPFGFVDLTSAYGQIKNGKLKALAVTSAKRAATAPELPTIAEAGIGNFNVIAWMGLFAPAGTPTAIVARLETEVEGILKRPDVRDRLIAQTSEPSYEPSAKFSENLRNESKKWNDIIRQLRGQGR